MVIKNRNQIEFFKREGKFYKGNLHIHTTLSDGQLSVDDAIAAYKGKGYDFIAITDHAKAYIADTGERAGNELLILNGIEFDRDYVIKGSTNKVIYKNFHILGIGIKKEIYQNENDTVQSLINKIVNADGMTILCHPHWSNNTHEDFLSLRGLTGFEIYNDGAEIIDAKGLSQDYWDGLLANDMELYGFAVDDQHFIPDASYNGGYIYVKSDKYDRESILENIRKGNFYSSNGPIIKNLYLDGDLLKVETSDAVQVKFITNFGGKVLFDNWKTLNYAEYSLTDKRYGYEFVRIEVTDNKGRKAWTNPILFEPQNE